MRYSQGTHSSAQSRNPAQRPTWPLTRPLAGPELPVGITSRIKGLHNIIITYEAVSTRLAYSQLMLPCLQEFLKREQERLQNAIPRHLQFDEGEYVLCEYGILVGVASSVPKCCKIDFSLQWLRFSETTSRLRCKYAHPHATMFSVLLARAVPGSYQRIVAVVIFFQ